MVVCREEAALIELNDCWRQHELQKNKKNTWYNVAIRAEASDKPAKALASVNICNYLFKVTVKKTVTIKMKEAFFYSSDIASVRSVV